MNVLLLTPDAVGGTLLHTLLSVYMQFHEFDRPVVSLNDLVLGVEKNWHTDFNREILRTHAHYQPLDEIQQLVHSVDHYKVAKLTQYNIRRRKDSIAQQVEFYNYLNDNFFVIACRRDNVFEHSLSWALNKITNRLNVYSFNEKVSAFAHIYSDGVKIDPISLVRSLDDYKEFLQWCDDNFSVASYYRYEQNLHNIENYILDLPIFNGQSKKKSWQDVYDISFNDWNRYHYLSSDIGGLAMQDSSAFKNLAAPHQVPSTREQINYTKEKQEALEFFIADYRAVADQHWPQIHSLSDYENLPDRIKHECEHVHCITYHLDTIRLHINAEKSLYSSTNSITTVDSAPAYQKLSQAIQTRNQYFLDKHHSKYHVAAESISHMRDLGLLVKTIPVKKQTLAEKAFIVKNFNQCVDIYNEWASKNPSIGSVVTVDDLTQQSIQELESWNKKQNLL